MRHIIWRNRASAILGLFVMLIPFTGFPEVMRDSLIVLSGFLIALFGFYHGSSNYAISEESLVINVENENNINSQPEQNVEAQPEAEIKSKAHRRAKVNNDESSSSD